MHLWWIHLMETKNKTVSAPSFRVVSRAVANPRHSTCGSARLAELDFTEMFTDTSFGAHYLHVAHRDGETWHRVHCRASSSPRIKISKGVVYWLFSVFGERKPRAPKLRARSARTNIDC
jgi:hypothetical protein